MPSTVLGLALFGLLAVAVLPVPRVRRMLLTASARLGRAVVLGGGSERPSPAGRVAGPPSPDSAA